MLLGFFWFVVVSLIVILLFIFFLCRVVWDVKKLIIFIVQDQFEFVGVVLGVQKVVYLLFLNVLQVELEGEYEVKMYGFGSEVWEGIDFVFIDK